MCDRLKKVVLVIGILLGVIVVSMFGGLNPNLDNVRSDTVSPSTSIFNEQNAQNIGHSSLTAKKFENNTVTWTLTWEKPATKKNEALDLQLLLNKNLLTIDQSNLRVESSSNNGPATSLDDAFEVDQDGHTLKQMKPLKDAQKLEVTFTTVLPAMMQKADDLSGIQISAHVLAQASDQSVKNVLTDDTPVINIAPLLLANQASSSDSSQEQSSVPSSSSNSQTSKNGGAASQTETSTSDGSSSSVVSNYVKRAFSNLNVSGINAPSSNTTIGNLVISDSDFNSASQMANSITISGLSGSDYDIRSYEAGDAPHGSYDKTGEMEDNIYEHYLSKSGKVNIEFSTDLSAKKLAKAVVSYQYQKIGYVVSNSGQKIDVGAKVTISGMAKSDGDGWHKDGFPDQTPFIDISTNMFSGNEVTGINSAMYDIEFTNAKTGADIDFSSGDYNNSFLTFSSLNGYQKDGKKGDYDYGEFVQPQNGSQGTTAPRSIVKQGTVQVEAPGKGMPSSYDNVYYGADEFPPSDDQLGLTGYPKGSVSFSLSGQHNQFLIGTGGGAGAAEWFTFSSAAIAPVKQTAPTKTVEPLNQYRAGDSWDKPTGNTVGFNQRYFNDLDRYNDGQGGWDLPNEVRVAGHDADLPDSLLSGVPKKADRFVKDGQSYYYFINQKTINPVSQDQSMPLGYAISDVLPDGVTLADSKNLADDFTLYNLDGTEIASPFTADSLSQTNNGKFNLTLTDAATTQINNLDQLEAHYGQDFSLRVKVTVHNSGTDNINDLMTNQANTTFNYADSIHFSTNTNKVQTRVKDEIKKITFIKQNSANTPLKNAQFTLYHADSNSNPTGSSLGEYTSDDKGQFTLVLSKAMAPGKYVFVETQAPAGYSKNNFAFNLNADGTITGLNQNGSGAYILIDKKIPMDIALLKIDGVDQKALSGATYELSVDNNGTNQVIGTKKTDQDGKIQWGDLDPAKTYFIKETQAPDGYELSKDEYKITYDMDANTWQVLLDGIVVSDGKSSDSGIHVQLSVKDQPTFKLPSTGGIGTIGFTLVGLLLIGGGIILFIKKRGKSR